MGRFVSCFATCSIEANRGRGQNLREDKVLATPLENNDQSAFIARINICCGGGGGTIIPTVLSILTKFGKTQVGKTATLETYNFGKVQFWK